MSHDSTFSLRRSPALPYVELRRADRSSACYQLHSHDEFSFGVVDRGCAVYRNRRYRNRIGAGTTVTINPGDAHSCNPSTDRWSYRMLFVDALWLGQLQQELTGSSQDYQPFPGLFDTDAQTYRQFDLLFVALERETDPLPAESLLIEFLHEHVKAARPPVGDSPRREYQELAAVRDLIMDRLNDSISLDELCRAAGLNRYQLIRRFKRAYGQAPHAYQLDQRIKKAKTLLRRGDCSLNNVALELGFADQAHFQRHFKQRLAMTPGQYQASVAGCRAPTYLG